MFKEFMGINQMVDECLKHGKFVKFFLMLSIDRYVFVRLWTIQTSICILMETRTHELNQMPNISNILLFTYEEHSDMSSRKLENLLTKLLI